MTIERLCKRMTVEELRKLLHGMPNNSDVFIEEFNTRAYLDIRGGRIVGNANGPALIISVEMDVSEMKTFVTPYENTEDNVEFEDYA